MNRSVCGLKAMVGGLTVMFAAASAQAAVVSIGTPTKLASSSSESFTVNMTVDGETDWAVWGFQDPDSDPLTAANRKDNGSGSPVNAISDLTQINAGDGPETLENWDATWVPFHATYTDGTLSPTSATDQESLLRMAQSSPDIGDGFQLTVDAGTEGQILTLYLFARSITGTVTASLSGSGVSDTIDFENEVRDDGIWEIPITFADDLDAQTLTIDYTVKNIDAPESPDQQSIGISGATLAVPEPASLALLSLGGLMMLKRRRTA